MKRRFPNTLHLRIAWCLLLVLPLMAVAGCADRSAGKEQAKVGLATANTLAAYYESLVQDTMDIVEIKTFLIGLLGGSVEDSQLKELWVTIDALNYRARLAHRLTSTYNALNDLSSYDASGEIKDAVGNLVGLLTKTPQLPGAQVDPSGLFGSVAADLAAWRQSRDIRKGIQLVLSSLEKFAKLFEKETEAYKSIPQQRGDQIMALIEYRIRVKRAILWPSIQKVVDALDLPLDSLPDDQESGLRIVNAFRQLARVRLQRATLLSASAADSTAQALSALVDSHRTFLAGRSPSVAQVLTWLQKAQSYLDEIAKLRKKE